MSHSVRRLLFSTLALALLAGLPSPMQASTAPFLSYSQNGIGDSRAAACADATQAILDNCALHGPITTDPTGCHTIWDLAGNPFKVCTCTATTSFCGNLIPFPG